MQEICSYRQKFVVTIYDIDFTNKLKMSSILNYFQEAATHHSHILGVDYYNLMKENEYWILSRICVEIDKYPKLGEEIEVISYPIAPRIIDCDRDYYILNNKGEVLIRGVSKWLILDATTNKIKRINTNYFYNIIFYDSRAIENPVWKIENNNQLSDVYKSIVRLDDIDINKHMNNAKYANIIFNALSEEEIINNDIIAFSVNYLSQMYRGQEYTVKKGYNKIKDLICEIECDNNATFRASIRLKGKNI